MPGMIVLSGQYERKAAMEWLIVMGSKEQMLWPYTAGVLHDPMCLAEMGTRLQS